MLIYPGLYASQTASANNPASNAQYKKYIYLVYIKAYPLIRRIFFNLLYKLTMALGAESAGLSLMGAFLVLSCYR